MRAPPGNSKARRPARTAFRAGWLQAREGGRRRHGNEVLKLGYPPGPAVAKAIAVAFRVMSEHPAYPEDMPSATDAARGVLLNVLNDPQSVSGQDPDDLRELADALLEHRARLETSTDLEILDEAAPFAVCGPDLIDENTLEQMRNAMRLPVTVAGFLAPDAHIGYGLPIGGVWATEGTVSPYAVGVDIGCRMQVSVFDVEPEAVSMQTLKTAVLRHTRFGSGSAFQGRDRNDDPVLESPEWREHPWLRKNPGLRDTAHDQLGTSGGGNHFINAGTVEYPDGTRRLGIMTHSGSRGFGAMVAGHYSKLAQRLRKGLDKNVIHLAWFDLDSEEGQEYWRAMQLAGAYAAANHNVIHERVGRHLDLPLLDSVSNFHNFAWLEEVVTPSGDRKQAVVHRKGATPAGEGVRGVIPGSMGTPARLVVGKGNVQSLNSASHGSGRVMSRRQAKAALAGRDLGAEMRAMGVELLGGALDEAPEVYKPIDEVMRYQEHLVETQAVFHPKLVRMAGD